ncbi:MAG: flavin reductase [Bacilli bacterium]|nr:flavin reductase [Bacilli bacterium]
MRKDFGKKSWLVPMPVFIIGTYDENGVADAMNAAWGGMYDTNQVTVSLGSHVSTDNIRKNKAFTISFATKKTVEASDYVGLVSFAKDPKKLEKAGLHPFKSEKVNAPLFKEYPLTIECELVSLDGEEGKGGTLVGDIINISADESILTEGKIDFDKLEAIAFDPINNKYRLVKEEVADAFKVGMNIVK